MASTNINMKRKNSFSYFNVGIMLAITFGVGLLPTFGQVTPLGMQVLGIFLGVLYGWIFVDILWPSIFAMVALGLTDITTINDAFSAGIGNSMIIMVLMTVIFAGALDECKITDWIANWFLTRKIIKGRPWVLISMMLIAGAFMGMFASGLAGTFILWAITLKLAEMCGYKQGNMTISFIMALLVIVPTCGANAIPFQPGAILFSSFFTQAMGGTIPYVPFILYNLIVQTFVFGGILLCGKFILKLDVSKFNLPDEMYEELKKQKTTYEQKIGLIAVVAFFLMLFLPGVLPKTFPGMIFLAKLGIIGVSAVILIILTVMRTSEGKPFINFTSCHRSIPWSMIWLMASTFPLSAALKSEDTGIMSSIMSAVVPLLSNVDIIVFFIGSTVLLTLLTQVTVNMVLGAMFIPFLCEICVQLGGNPYTLFMLLFIGLQAAYVTPAASAGGAMMHGHSWIKGKNAYITGALFMLITLVVLIAIGIPLGNMLF